MKRNFNALRTSMRANALVLFAGMSLLAGCDQSGDQVQAVNKRLNAEVASLQSEVGIKSVAFRMAQKAIADTKGSNPQFEEVFSTDSPGDVELIYNGKNRSSDSIIIGFAGSGGQLNPAKVDQVRLTTSGEAKDPVLGGSECYTSHLDNISAPTAAQSDWTAYAANSSESLVSSETYPAANPTFQLGCNYSPLYLIKSNRTYVDYPSLGTHDVMVDATENFRNILK